MADGTVVEPAVLFHCLKGISRSASVIVAYTMRERKLLYKEAVAIVKEGRNCIMPNPGFVEQLDTWACLIYDIFLRDEYGVVTATKQLYYKVRARWEIVEKLRTAQHAAAEAAAKVATKARGQLL